MKELNNSNILIEIVTDKIKKRIKKNRQPTLQDVLLYSLKKVSVYDVYNPYLLEFKSDSRETFYNLLLPYNKQSDDFFNFINDINF